MNLSAIFWRFSHKIVYESHNQIPKIQFSQDSKHGKLENYAIVNYNILDDTKKVSVDQFQCIVTRLCTLVTGDRQP